MNGLSEVEQQPRARSGWRWRGLAVVLGLMVLVVAPLRHMQFLNASSMSPTTSDLAQVWVGVRAIVHGVDPYSNEATREIQRIYYGHELAASDTRLSQRFAYPAQIAVVMAPLALISWPLARLLFLCVTPLLMAASVPMWLRLLGIAMSRRRLAVVVVLVLASWPMIWGLRLCQMTLVVAAFVVAACWLLRFGQGVGAGVVLSLATVKPQVAGLVIAWLLIWAVVTRRWTFVASFVASTATLLLTAQVLAPGWISRWLVVLNDYSHFTQMRPVLVMVFGRFVGMGLLIAIVVGSGFVLWRLWGCRADSPEFGAASALVLAVTACLLPPLSGMIYNQVLLLPAVLLLFDAGASTGGATLMRWLVMMLVAFEFVSVPFAVFGESVWGPSAGWLTLPFMNLLLPACTASALVLHLRGGGGAGLRRLPDGPESRFAVTLRFVATWHGRKPSETNRKTIG